MKVFASIGFVFLVIAALSGITVLAQYLTTGVVIPNISYAILTTMLCLTGLQVFVFGLIADMLKYQRIREEEILYHLKKIEME